MNFISELVRPFSRERYQPSAVLRGHQLPVLSMAISSDGKHLASGGYEGIKLWDLTSHRQIPIPECGGPRKGSVTSILWLPNGGLAYGTTLGFLVVWTFDGSKYRVANIRKLATNGSVVGMDHSTPDSYSRTRLVVACRDGTIHLYALGTDGLQHIYTVELEGVVPAAVAFSADMQNVTVFSQNDGDVFKLHCENGNTISRQQSGSDVIGDATLGKVNGKEMFIIDNGFNGFDLFSLSDCEWHSRMLFHTSATMLGFPKQVAFGEQGGLVIGGSHRDVVYIFSTGSGKLLDRLPHNKWGLVQTVAVGSVPNERRHLIAVGASGNRGTIKIWQRTELDDWISLEKIKDTIAYIAYTVVQLTIVFFACCHLYQQYGEAYSPTIKSWIVEYAPSDIVPYVWGENAIWRDVMAA